MRKHFNVLTLVVLSAVTFAVAVSAADLASKTFEPGKEYVWVADLVSVDQATGTLTAKARLRYGLVPEYEQFKPGDQIALQWYTSAWGETDGIQDLARRDRINELGFYAMPVEFVSLDRASKTVLFKTAIKGDALRTVKSLSPNGSIRVMSPYWPAAEGNPILSVEKYTAASRPSMGN